MLPTDENGSYLPRIQKLPEHVINRIAAGEVIIRPSNALKELLENALDAQCTRVTVTVKDGGMKLLQISDDGIGIQEEDLPLLCERFATSKLRTFSDLSTIQSFGFRGEALASISYVSHVTVTTCPKQQRKKTAQASIEGRSCSFVTAAGKTSPPSLSDPMMLNNVRSEEVASITPSPCVGFTCRYLNGSMVALPTPGAATPGTTFVAENMFYNLPIRRQALKNVTEEYNRILEVVQKYAIHFPSVSFVCRKLGHPRPDVMTTGCRMGDGMDTRDAEKSSGTKDETSREKENLSQIFNHSNLREQTGQETGQQPSRHSLRCDADEHLRDSNPKLLHSHWNRDGSLKVIQNLYESSVAVSDLQELKVVPPLGASPSSLFEIHGFVSSPHTSARKTHLVLFINDRLVESTTIKRWIDNLKNEILPKNTKYWMYISIFVPSSSVDVNMHPTKKEVLLLHEERIVSKLVFEIEALWRVSTESKTFSIQRAMVDTKSVLRSVCLSSASSFPSTPGHHPSSSFTPSSVRLVTLYNGETPNHSNPTQRQSSPETMNRDQALRPRVSPLREDPIVLQSSPAEEHLPRRTPSISSEMASRYKAITPIPPVTHSPVDSASSESVPKSMSVYRTRTDRRQTTLHACMDLRPSKVRLAVTTESTDNAPWKEHEERMSPTSASSTRGADDVVNGSKSMDGKRRSEMQTIQLEPKIVSNGFKANATRRRGKNDDDSLCIDPVEETKDTELTTLNQVDVECQRLSFRVFLVPPSLSLPLNSHTVGLRFHPNDHPLGSTTKHQDREEQRVNQHVDGDVENGSDVGVGSYDESDADELESIAELTRRLDVLMDPAMSLMLTQSTYIGAIDDSRALVQYESNLIMIDIKKIFKQAVYQSILYRFGFLPTVQFTPTVDLGILIYNAIVDCEMSGYDPDRLQQKPEELSKIVIKRVLPFRGMLDEYFGIAMDPTGKYLTEFPLCCGRYFPGLDALGMFFLRIGLQVIWTDEKLCLEGICVAVAEFYGTLPSLDERSKQLTASLAAATGKQSRPHLGESTRNDLLSDHTRNDLLSDHTRNDLLSDHTNPLHLKSLQERPENSSSSKASALTSGPALLNEKPYPTAPPSLSNTELYPTAAPPLICELFEFVFHPSIAFNKNLRIPSSYVNDGSFKILTTLEKLYRVFERC